MIHNGVLHSLKLISVSPCLEHGRGPVHAHAETPLVDPGILTRSAELLQ